MTADRKPKSLHEDIEAWLKTVAVDAEFLAASLDDTIIPDSTDPLDNATTAKRERDDAATAKRDDAATAKSIGPGSVAPGSIAPALAVLHEVAGLSPTSTAQLQQGEVIAEGGMGVIRAGYQVSLGRAVAVKSLRPDRQTPRAEIDLLREAWVTGAVEHPNVVPVHYVGVDDAGRPLIVLKRVEGVSWHDLIADADAVRRRFGATDLFAWNLSILMQLLNALRFAHARGIVHRDLKPANVMIGEFGEVYLLDWGIAVSLRDDHTGRLPLASRATELAGTPVYMAPEMLGRDGSPPISERTDVYLAGAVLYEIIAGKPPHEGSTVLAVITSVALSEPNLPPETPAELTRICTRAMQADPAARFESVEELRLALVSYLEHRGSARLLDLANERLARLLEVLGATSAGTLEDEIYRLFGACRFGFHEALAAWRDNEEASRGLVRATAAVAEYELARGDPRAAQTLLSELAEPPADLLARARRAVAEQATRLGEADQLRRDYDTVVGARTRSLVMGVLGVLFTAMPLVGALDPEFVAAGGYAGHAVVSLVFFVIVLGFGIWARESMTATVLNRRGFVAVQAVFVAHALLFLATWRLGISIHAMEVLMMFLWAVISGMAALAIDRRLTPGFVMYLVAFGVALWIPAQRFYIMAAANFLFAALALHQWRPWSAPRRNANR